MIQAVIIREGGDIGVVGATNSDGTRDMGPMQINPWWMPLLRPMGISEHDLLYDVCTNIAVGAFILQHNYELLGDWYEAVAAYNAGPANRHVAYGYADDVFALMGRPTREQGTSETDITINYLD